MGRPVLSILAEYFKGSVHSERTSGDAARVRLNTDKAPSIANAIKRAVSLDCAPRMLAARLLRHRPLVVPTVVRAFRAGKPARAAEYPKDLNTLLFKSECPAAL